MNELDNVDDPCDAPLILRNLKLKNINRLVLTHLNINSLSAKFANWKEYRYSSINRNQN